ncbi:MAG TPA: gamma-glutamyltransferase, partial [Vicinamibacteria bacterium]|nr:gamma-glutamyltransferase [Vicinamibacteria bacterium]
MRPDILGQHGIVAAGRHYSVAAGVRILQQGGNAIDAGVASVLAAAVVEISHFGFGGESPVIIHDAKTKKVVVISGQGTAPKAATPDLFAEKGIIDPNGPLATTVPAVMDAMALALDGYGTMRFEQVMQPAIELADGFPMYAFLRQYLISEREKSEIHEGTKRAYYPEGTIPEVGDVFRQPDLARTLRAIVAAEKAAYARTKNRRKAIRAARDAFYKGDIAKRIAEGTRKAGGVLAYADLATYEGAIEEPVSTTFHGYTVHKAGPWNQGPVLLQALTLLEGFDLRAMGHNSAEYLHTLHEAV